MTARRLLLASALALAWCWSAWHEDLEAAGWMFAHEHHHPHPTAADAASDHAPGHADDEASAHRRLQSALALARLRLPPAVTSAPPAALREVPPAPPAPPAKP
jgi:hypothetical protein